MKFNHGIIDAHVHTHGGCTVDGFIRNGLDHLNAAGVDAENLLCVKHGRSACVTEPNALLLKAMMPGKFSVFGNPSFMIPEFGSTPEGVALQVRDFLEGGLDGVKLADSNGGEGTPLDSPIFDPMFSVLEETGAPIIYHVGSAVFLPPRRVFVKNPYPVENPPFLIYKAGEDDDKPASSQISPEAQEAKYEQMERLLDRHPDVNITFPHTYFLSQDTDRLASFLDRHPKVMIDLTPCSEIYWNFSQNPAKAREFICDYSSRITFGTDNTTELDPLPLINLIRQFLETDESFYAASWGFDVQGIKLPAEVLEKIYQQNFLRFLGRGDEGASAMANGCVNRVKAAEYCEKIYEIVRTLEEMPKPNQDEALECAERIRKL